SDPPAAPSAETRHASAVAAQTPDGPCAALLLGPSGAGKSALALEMISRGAVLVADDQVRLRRRGARVIASAPETLAGLIEARGFGLIETPALAEAPVVCLVDLSEAETRRLPPRREALLLGLALPRILAPPAPLPAASLAPALLALLRAGGARRAP
ncbi:MAG: HPr kinase/phosphatase C-terminal domain-containing protein, partial [Pseudomonadota bacterium]